MSLKLPYPPNNYDPEVERRRNLLLEQADAQNLKFRRELELGADTKFVIQSANGARWRIIVTDEGTLDVEPAKTDPIDFEALAFNQAFG